MSIREASAQNSMLGLTPDPGPATVRDWKLSGSDAGNDELLHYMCGYVHAMVDAVDTFGIQGFSPTINSDQIQLTSACG